MALHHPCGPAVHRGARRGQEARADDLGMISQCITAVHHGGTEGTEKKSESWRFAQSPKFRVLRASVVNRRSDQARRATMWKICQCFGAPRGVTASLSSSSKSSM